MSTREVQAPVFVVTCDRDGCLAQHRATRRWDQRSAHQARWSARDAGWQVRPGYGKGSRSAPDFCPRHRTEPAA